MADCTARTQKSYRRPRRRPAHLRTKTGCLTCRSRKKKCDESGSPCQNCLRCDIECVWPVRRPSHVDDQLTHPGSSSISAEPASDTEYQLVDTQTPSIIAFSNGPASYSSVLTPADSQLFSFLQTIFLPQLIHPVTKGLESLRWAFQSPFCMHALLACAAAEIPVNNLQYRRMAEMHYIKAVAGLRQSLVQTGDSSQWTVVLWTVLMLCIYERSKPHHSQGVDVHLAGAAQLIQMYFRQKIPDASTNATGAWARLFLESFVFHVSTSIPFQLTSTQSTAIDSAFYLAENILEVLCRPHISVDTTSPVLGVPPKLFQYVYTIARMYQQYPDYGVDISYCNELEQDLRRWDSLMAGTAAPELLAGPRLYVLCSRILLNRLMNPGGNQSDSFVRELVSHAMALVTQLQPAQDYFAEYYSWPLLVLGTCAQTQPDQQILLSQIQGFWQATNNGTMKRLENMLTAYWTNGESTAQSNLWLI
ncbi:Zn(II)2Cys6 transcription factor [Aspergillus novofumigatus IBT 16806]|uniref:C6 zinc finger domain protein n=1 Tax=Aspergillus novofumigatus (strain IBT 16806) TaxID=1392255 RepID=A0A2I1CFM2_ASPN1|nr:C6 zinc finger domain protein [Aspergillus novofumigatus IBT 16806]PKX96425.1 C6 zinc finger domain protein [Aspergillus novofumigatus IBT 16806]